MTSTAPPLSPLSRDAALREMASANLDILVVGAGVVGAGAALDAATRGLRVGLVEASDYGSGTSSRSSKLVHGGLRYLKQLHVPLVREALRERRLILEQLCPHLARPVPFIYPLQRPVWDRTYVGLGIGAYDLLGAGSGVPGHARHLGRKATLSSFPSAKRGAVRGGILFYEGQLDDARHTMMLARTAAAHGALVANSARVTGLHRDGERVVGAQVTDVESGAQLALRASVVVLAAGVWTEEFHELLGEHRFHTRASKGVHLLVPRSAIESATGLITETEKSLLFVIPCPWSEQFWIIGTTDTPWSLDLRHPATSQADIDYLLERVNRLLEAPVTRDDVVGVYAGLRPLVGRTSDETSKLSRKHVVVSPVPGAVVVSGGKYTTYRVMAAQAVEAAARDLPFPVARSRTDSVPLVGSDGYDALLRHRERLAPDLELPTGHVDRLLGRYGVEVHDLSDLVRARPDLAHPLVGAPRYLRVEAQYAVSHEGALHLEDILARRLRVSVDTPSRGLDTASEVANLVAPLLGWSASDIARELDYYTAQVEAERGSQLQPDDLTANAARLVAPDVRDPHL